MPSASHRLLLLLTLLLPLGCRSFPSAVESARPAVIRVDWGRSRQAIVGFGGTMGWIHPAPAKRDEIFDLLFTTLGASLLRIQALAGEGGDEESLEPDNDNADPNAFDWARFPIAATEAKNAVIIRAALDRGVKTILPVTWSPPGWMKDTGRRAGGGQLKEELLDEYAELWAAYVIGMKREFDIGVRLISIQNEPDLEYYYPTCRIRSALYARAVAAVERRMKKEKLDVRVAVPDTCRMYHLEEYLDELAKAGTSLGTPILAHLYDLSIPFDRVDRDPPRWREARDLARKHRRPLWLMETANYLGYSTEHASYDEALIWAQKIHWALVAGDCEVVCYWSLFFDKPNEALIYCERSECPDYRITPKFYTSMNYYRFVRPGMVHCEAACGDAVLLVSAFRAPRPAGGEQEDNPRGRVIVIVNPGSAPKRLALADGLPGEWQRFETTPDANCEQAAPVRSGREIIIPARSVTTLTRPD